MINELLSEWVFLKKIDCVMNDWEVIEWGIDWLFVCFTDIYLGAIVTTYYTITFFTVQVITPHRLVITPFSFLRAENKSTSDVCSSFPPFSSLFISWWNFFRLTPVSDVIHARCVCSELLHGYRWSRRDKVWQSLPLHWAFYLVFLLSHFCILWQGSLEVD